MRLIFACSWPALLLACFCKWLIIVNFHATVGSYLGWLMCLDKSVHQVPVNVILIQTNKIICKFSKLKTFLYIGSRSSMFQVFNVCKSVRMADLRGWIYSDPVISVLSELLGVKLPQLLHTQIAFLLSLVIWTEGLFPCEVSQRDVPRDRVCCIACWVYSSWPSLAERNYYKSKSTP